MDISDRQQRAGAMWGALAFGAGVAVAWWIIDPGTPPSRLKRAVWVFLSSHYVTIGPIQVEATVRSLPRLGVVTRGERPVLWHSIPILVGAIGATGINMGLGRTTDPNKILKNSGLLLIGYLPIALIAAVWSGAVGAVGWLLAIIAGAFLALAVGSRAVGGTTQGTPVLAITSLGGLLIIGLILLLGGLLILEILIPIAALAASGIVLGSGVVYVARTYT